MFAAFGLSGESRSLHRDICEEPTKYDYHYNNHYAIKDCISEKKFDARKSATTCYGFQIFVALVQAGVAIAASAMSCRIICCSKQEYTGGVVYSPAHNQPQQFMMVPPNQFANPQQFVTVPSNQVAPFGQGASPVVMQQQGKILDWIWTYSDIKNTLILIQQCFSMW